MHVRTQMNAKMDKIIAHLMLSVLTQWAHTCVHVNMVMLAME